MPKNGGHGFFWPVQALVALSMAALLLLIPSCDEKVADDPSATLLFSADSVLFDTVFTAAGSSTRRVVLRNPGKRALKILSVRQEVGGAFVVNFDGEQNLSLVRDVTLAGGDSLFIFVRADIDPVGQDLPLLVEDRLLVETSAQPVTLYMQAYGWDVEILDKRTVSSDLTLSAAKPYLVRGYLLVDKGATLTMPAGCHVFMHDTAQIACYGGFIAQGTAEQPVMIQSDRLDNIFEDIPYLYVGGRWDGVYLVEPDTVSVDHTEILSGNVGLYMLGSGKERLTLTNSRLHNHNYYGLVVIDADALIANTEISNCASYGVYLYGGRHEFVHTTIASYFNSTRFAIQTTLRVDSIAPMYINNLSKKHHTEVRFLNSVLAGAQRNCLMVATPLPQYYVGEFAWSYLQTDTLPASLAHDITYPVPGNYEHANRDTLFVNNYYSERGQYYDFRPDSLSPLRDIADSTVARRFPLDRLGNDRFADGRPDAGCYERTDN